MLGVILVGIALILGFLLLTVLASAATQPDTFRVSRAIHIDAPPAKVFQLIDDLQSWSVWSPWERKDPDMKRAFSGPRAGKGAAYAWEGDKNVGKGRLEIVDSAPPDRVAIGLEMIEPIAAKNDVEFVLKPAGSGTDVLWTMQGPSQFIGKVMDTIFNMDRMVGADFEKGLADLKAAAEK